ncbi:MAG: leucine-rich repeat domain-containing protein [Phycisphaerae bacterium]|nr:leucine-rich repeat domain-containing protein [Phycisphaerae bacterium]
MNTYAQHVVGYLLAQGWQIAILAGIVGLISFALRKRSAHVRYLLWLIVLAKCLVPPLLPVPLAVLPERSASPPTTAFAPPQEYSAPEIRVSVGVREQPRTSTGVVPGVRVWIALAWTLGAFSFLLWVGGRAVRYTLWLRNRRRPLPSALQESIQNLWMSFKFKRWPRIWLLEDVSQPFVWGLTRGSVYLPADFVAVVGSDQQQNVLAHELSHIVRYDAGVNLLQVLAQAVYWFHPFVWWANRKIRQEREKCCDEMAVAQLNTRPEHYTGAIVDALAAERRSDHPIPSLAVVGSIRDIEERIRTMLTPGKTFRRRPSLAAATLALLVALVAVPTRLVLTARGQAQASALSAVVEKPEQPRFAARTFNSKLPFMVSVKESYTGGWSPVGSTPGATPLQIPACWCWQVILLGPVEDWGALAREMSLNKVPGLGVTAGTDSDLKHLADLRDLRCLALLGPGITDAGLEHLKGLTELEVLELGGAQITDAGLIHLKGLTGLRELHLRGAHITGAGLQQLQGLAKLEWLDLIGSQIADAGLEDLKGLTGLRILNLGGPGITDASMEHLKGLTGLRTLLLAGTQVTGQGLVHLDGLTALESLGLAGCPIKDAGLAHVESLTKLDHLNLTKTQITDAGLAYISKITTLEYLILDKTGITSAGLEHLRGLTALSTLGLQETQITDAGLQYLAGLKGLRQLWLDNTRIGDAGLERFKGLTGLRELSLQNTQITDAGLQYLEGLKGLRQLWLDNTQIGDAGLEHLGSLTELRTLELVGTQITDAGLEHLKGLTKLEGLYLAHTRITDAGLKYLQGLTGLRVLGLIETQVTDAGIQQLKQSLPNVSVIRKNLLQRLLQLPGVPAANAQTPAPPQPAVQPAADSGK